MKVQRQIFLYLLTFIIFINIVVPSFAILGNTIEQNDLEFATSNIKQKFNYSGDKNVYTYFKDNITITVVYRNNISILEQIAYKQAVDPNQAEADVKLLSLPKTLVGPVFTSSMSFLDGFFKENLYNGGIKSKLIFNNEGKATDIVSSVFKSN